ncbi:rhomboid family intramembrane serine protease [Elongatibacter sediminis]|uniref:Rhomboid family intramembrane serine protease n=1 Tax=Elongatibacter sediminis TaxID=3119006 RepID=A0AAW9RBS0_9GAMM
MTISVLCLALLGLYFGVDPRVQQAMIDLGGMKPSQVEVVFERPFHAWLHYPAVTLLSSVFLHASGVHLAGNLAYLWVFGLPVEQRIGTFAMIVLFLAGGTLANIIVALQLGSLETPIIGASGAVSAVVGAYLGLFPSRRIGMFLPLGLYLQFAQVPSILVIGSWFTLQLLYTVFGPINAAVAWWTHLAGFALGLSIALIYRAIVQFRG